MSTKSLRERLDALATDINVLAQRNTNMQNNRTIRLADNGGGTDVSQKFRDELNARMNASRDDINDQAARLEIGKQILRDWMDSPENQGYATALSRGDFENVVRETDGPGISQARDSYGSRTFQPAPPTQAGGLGGQRARTPAPATFPNQAGATPFKEATQPELYGFDALRARHDASPNTYACTFAEKGAKDEGRSQAARIAELSDVFRSRHPGLVPSYGREAAPVAPIPDGLVVMLNDAWAKLPAGEPARLGKAMRAAAAEAPPQWLPTYGRRS